MVVWSSMSRVTVVPAFGRRLADGPGVLEGDGVAVLRQGLADGAELDAHLGGAVRGEVGLGERLEQVHVGVAGGLGAGPVGGVLAEVVDRREAVGRAQLGRDGDRLVDGLTRDVARDDRAAHGCLHHRGPDQVGVGQLEHGSPEQVTGVHGDRLSGVGPLTAPG